MTIFKKNYWFIIYFEFVLRLNYGDMVEFDEANPLWTCGHCYTENNLECTVLAEVEAISI